MFTHNINGNSITVENTETKDGLLEYLEGTVLREIGEPRLYNLVIRPGCRVPAEVYGLGFGKVTKEGRTNTLLEPNYNGNSFQQALAIQQLVDRGA